MRMLDAKAVSSPINVLLELHLKPLSESLSQPFYIPESLAMMTPSPWDAQDHSHRIFKLPTRESTCGFPGFFLCLLSGELENHPGMLSQLMLFFFPNLVWFLSDLDCCIIREAFRGEKLFINWLVEKKTDTCMLTSDLHRCTHRQIYM